MAAPKKVSDRQVRWLRNMAGRYSVRELARIVGCSAMHASDIIKRRRRASVPDHS